MAVKVPPAPRCRPPDAAADPEVAGCRSDGGRRMEGYRGRYSAGFGDFAVACQYLPASRIRPVGGRLAQEVGDVVVVRYADDNVLGIQHRAEARRFMAELRG